MCRRTRSGIARERQTQHRGLRRARSSQRAVTTRRDVGTRAYTPPCGERAGSPPPPGHLARACLRQEADAVLGPRESRAGGQDRQQAGGRPRRRDAQDVRRRRGLLPLPGVDPRRRRLHRPAHLRQPAAGHDAERLADGAAADDRRGGRRLRPPRDRRDAVVRLLAPGQEVVPARADLRPPRGPRARVRGGRPRADDGPPRRPDPGLLLQAGRPHDRAVHAHPVLRATCGSRTSWSSRRTPGA